MANLIDARDMPGVEVIELKAFADSRGSFTETYRQAWFPGRPQMIQGNRSDSAANVLRGLHFHQKQSDYWYVPSGMVIAGLADLRPGSPTEGAVAALELAHPIALYIPPGVAHGYYAPQAATMTYLVDNYYDATDEFGVAWDDPQLAIPWQLTGDAPILSGRDQENPTLEALDPALIPAFREFEPVAR